MTDDLKEKLKRAIIESADADPVPKKIKTPVSLSHSDPYRNTCHYRRILWLLSPILHAKRKNHISGAWRSNPPLGGNRRIYEKHPAGTPVHMDWPKRQIYKSNEPFSIRIYEGGPEGEFSISLYAVDRGMHEDILKWYEERKITRSEEGIELIPEQFKLNSITLKLTEL